MLKTRGNRDIPSSIASVLPSAELHFIRLIIKISSIRSKYCVGVNSEPSQ